MLFKANYLFDELTYSSSERMFGKDISCPYIFLNYVIQRVDVCTKKLPL
jgi:hypothetical protein